MQIPSKSACSGKLTYKWIDCITYMYAWNYKSLKPCIFQVTNCLTFFSKAVCTSSSKLIMNQSSSINLHVQEQLHIKFNLMWLWALASFSTFTLEIIDYELHYCLRLRITTSCLMCHTKWKCQSSKRERLKRVCNYLFLLHFYAKWRDLLISSWIIQSLQLYLIICFENQTFPWMCLPMQY